MKSQKPKGNFWDIFKDKNEYNEKSIIGFLAFTVMVIYTCIDLITGYLGKEIVIHEYIYNSFVITTLGAFGIAGFEKVMRKDRHVNDDSDEYPDKRSCQCSDDTSNEDYY